MIFRYCASLAAENDATGATLITAPRHTQACLAGTLGPVLSARAVPAVSASARAATPQVSQPYRMTRPRPGEDMKCMLDLLVEPGRGSLQGARGRMVPASARRMHCRCRGMPEAGIAGVPGKPADHGAWESGVAAQPGDDGGADICELLCGEGGVIGVGQDDGLPAAAAGGEGVAVVAGEGAIVAPGDAARDAYREDAQPVPGAGRGRDSRRDRGEHLVQ